MEENKDQMNAGESSADHTPDTAAEKEKMKKRNKLIAILIALAVFILIPVLVYLVKQQEINNLQKEHLGKMETVKKEYSDLVAGLNTANLEISAHIMSWAVGAEIGKNNTELAGKYMTELAKKPNYRRVLLLDNAGKIILATDKKYEGEGFFRIFQKELVGGKPLTAIPQKSGEWLIFTPVEVIGQRVATLVIFYFPPSIDSVEVQEKPAAE